MGDAAHAESLNHDVYRTPFAVQPEYETWDTPDNYRRYPGGDALPKKFKVWRVQNTGKTYGGVVARRYGFTDSPDAEILAVGFNRGKEYGAVGIGRHGSFLQWGYSAPPSKMTKAGRKLFLNCIHYIHRFDGVQTLVRRESSDRTNAIRLAPIINRISGDQRNFFLGQFGEELYDRYHADPEGLVKYYQDNLEWIYRDGHFRVDEELKSLGLDSNRKIETLERLMALSNDPTHAETAQRLIHRYTDGHTTFDFKNARDRIYFTDVGGYKFKVAPPGYPMAPED